MSPDRSLCEESGKEGAGVEMTSGQTVWVDRSRCTGCGTCVDVCPAGAVALKDGKARIDEATCVGCEACVGACPEGAIETVVQGELVTSQARAKPAVPRPSPPAETPGTSVATGVGMLANAAGAVVRAVGDWITNRDAPALTPQQGQATNARRFPSSTAGGGRGRGRSRRRHKHGRRRRGRRGG